MTGGSRKNNSSTSSTVKSVFVSSDAGMCGGNDRVLQGDDRLNYTAYPGLQSTTTELESDHKGCQTIPEPRHTIQDKMAQLELADENEVELVVQSAPVSTNNSISPALVTHSSLPSDGVFINAQRQDGRRRRRKVNRQRYVSHYRPRKMVVVGDMCSGKSCLVSSYCADKYHEVYSPTIMRCMSSDTKVKGTSIDIIAVDTPGRYDYLPLRQVAYKKSDLIMICFALDTPQSLKNVEEFWIPEVQKNAPGIPYMLVGNRRDLRDEQYANWCCCEVCQDCHLGCEKGRNTLKRMEADKFLHSTLLSYDQGCLVAQDIGAVAYEECSAKFRDNTRRVFECATEMAMKNYRRKRKHKMRGPEACTIL